MYEKIYKVTVETFKKMAVLKDDKDKLTTYVRDTVCQKRNHWKTLDPNEAGKGQSNKGGCGITDKEKLGKARTWAQKKAREQKKKLEELKKKMKEKGRVVIEI